jgi:hypothetical protein
MDDKHSVFQGNPSQPSLSGLLDKVAPIVHPECMAYKSCKLDREHMKAVAKAFAAQKEPDLIGAINVVYPQLGKKQQFWDVWCALRRSMRFWTEVIECFRLAQGKNWRSLDRGGHPDPIRHARRLLAKSQKNTDSCSVTVP